MAFFDIDRVCESSLWENLRESHLKLPVLGVYLFRPPRIEIRGLLTLSALSTPPKLHNICACPL
jgi:hypothetical protein